MNLKYFLCIVLFTPLFVRANPETDRRIEDAADRSYNFRVALEERVKIRVEDGVATIWGKVGTNEQRQLAQDTVANLPGVVRVENGVIVKGEREGSDSWIALKARCRLLAKADVSLANTRVDVKHGVVILKGKACTPDQKAMTEDYVKDIDGVRGIQNEIELDARQREALEEQERDFRARYRRDEPLDDSSISAQIQYELNARKSTSALRPKIGTNEGHVVISGDAPSEADKQLVTQLAQRIRGVDSVANNMTVRRR